MCPFCFTTLPSPGSVPLTKGTSMTTKSRELCTQPRRGKYQPYFVYFFTISSTNLLMSFQMLFAFCDLKTKKTWVRGIRGIHTVGGVSASPDSSRNFRKSSPSQVAQGCHTLLVTSVGHPIKNHPRVTVIKITVLGRMINQIHVQGVEGLWVANQEGQSFYLGLKDKKRGMMCWL